MTLITKGNRMAKVLIIEDELPYRKVYKRKFEVSGYTVETAADGEEGLEKIRSFQPDIILLDVMMPKMDGFQVLQAVKSDDSLKAIPVLATTNLSTGDDSHKLLAMGAAEVIVKSDTEPNTLVEKVEQTLRGKA